MSQPPYAPPEFAILTPEAAKQHADTLLMQALSHVRAAAEACLQGTPETGSRLSKAVRVGQELFHIPEYPNAAAAKSLLEAIQVIAGSMISWGVKRAEVDDAAITRHPQIFAALYAWGYLHDPKEWEDIIRREPEPASTSGEAYKRDVLQVFTGFAHGSTESGIRFQNGDRQMCFDPTYQGRVARVVADCLGVSPSDLYHGQEPAAVAQKLLEAFPNLRGLSPQRPEELLEAMVAVLQGKESPA